jgi:hypothetical protein
MEDGVSQHIVRETIRALRGVFGELNVDYRIAVKPALNISFVKQKF